MALIRNGELRVSRRRYDAMQREYANPRRTADENAYAALKAAGLTDGEILSLGNRETEVVVDDGPE